MLKNAAALAHRLDPLLMNWPDLNSKAPAGVARRATANQLVFIYNPDVSPTARVILAGRAAWRPLRAFLDREHRRRRSGDAFRHRLGTTSEVFRARSFDLNTRRS